MEVCVSCTNLTLSRTCATPGYVLVSLPFWMQCTSQGRVPLKGGVSAQKVHPGAKKEWRELLGETEEKSFDPNEVSLICPHGLTFLQWFSNIVLLARSLETTTYTHRSFCLDRQRRKRKRKIRIFISRKLFATMKWVHFFNDAFMNQYKTWCEIKWLPFWHFCAMAGQSVVSNGFCRENVSSSKWCVINQMCFQKKVGKWHWISLQTMQ